MSGGILFIMVSLSGSSSEMREWWFPTILVSWSVRRFCGGSRAGEEKARIGLRRREWWGREVLILDDVSLRPTARLCGFAQATMTNYHKPGDLNNRNSFAHHAGGPTSKIKILAGWDPSEASLLGLQMSVSSLCPDIIFPQYLPVSQFPLLIRSPLELD